MDRLVCGDVGFGKTEVAVRAAFAAALNGKQTLMLVPTTVLAQQHWNTFRERYRDFPVTVEMVSRFRKPADVKRILADFQAGKVDVLIGTHRVLSRDVIPKELGLVIVDEEQRFGVAQKELLRSLRLEVDVLSLTATPIPRTLHMSLSGLRDISIIETPPEGRRPIRTHVGEYDEELVKTRPRARGRARRPGVLPAQPGGDDRDGRRPASGSSSRAARRRSGTGRCASASSRSGCSRSCAETRTCSSRRRSSSPASTSRRRTRSIVERADALGLAQLYQIRGRVGRSDLLAHAYLFYPDASRADRRRRAPAWRRSPTTPSSAPGSRSRCATSRSAARASCSAPSSTGTWPRSASSSTSSSSARPSPSSPASGGPSGRPVRVDARIDAYVPAEYIPAEAQKIDLHRRLALTETEDELRELEAATVDRYGPLPEPVENLFAIQAAKLKLAQLGADYLVFRGGKSTVGPLVLGSEELRALRDRVDTAVYRSARNEVSVKHEEFPEALAIGRCYTRNAPGSVTKLAANGALFS